MVRYGLKSVVTLGTQVYDCRTLSLRCEFYDFSQDEVVSLSREFYLWLCDMYGNDFMTDWHFNDRHIDLAKNLERKICGALDKGERIGFGSDGVVKNCEVTSPQKLRKKSWDWYSFHQLSLKRNVSVDYPLFWNNIFPDKCMENDILVERIHKLFSVEVRPYLNQYHAFDAGSGLVAQPYKNDPSHYHGWFHFDLCKTSIGANLDYFAELFVEFLRHISSKYSKVNGRVMLQPVEYLRMGGSPHMFYFSHNPDLDGSHVEAGRERDEWYHSYYLCGVEWCNVVSPLAKIHINSNNKADIDYSNIAVEELPGGGLFVTSKKDITSFGVNDLREMKKLLYDCLYPGSLSISIKDMFKKANDNSFLMCPRTNWANIPMLEGEIEVVSTYLVYRHIS